jgi:hypothetical protein
VGWIIVGAARYRFRVLGHRDPATAPRAPIDSGERNGEPANSLPTPTWTMRSEAPLAFKQAS